MTLISSLLLGLSLVAAPALTQCTQDSTYSCLANVWYDGGEGYCAAVWAGQTTDLQIPACLFKTAPCATATSAPGYAYGTPDAGEALCLTTPPASQASSACSCVSAAATATCSGTGVNQTAPSSTSIRWSNSSSTAGITVSPFSTPKPGARSSLSGGISASGGISGVGTGVSQESISSSTSSSLNATSSAITSVESVVVSESVFVSGSVIVSKSVVVAGNGSATSTIAEISSSGIALSASAADSASGASTSTSAMALPLSASLSKSSGAAVTTTKSSSGGSRPIGNQTTSAAGAGAVVTSTLTVANGSSTSVGVIVIGSGVTMSSGGVSVSTGAAGNGSLTLSSNAASTASPTGGVTSVSGIVVSSGMASVSVGISSVAVSIVVSEVISGGQTITVTSELVISGSFTSVAVNGTGTTISGSAAATATATGAESMSASGSASVSGTATISGFKTIYTVSSFGMVSFGSCYAPNPPIATLPEEFLDNFYAQPNDTYLDSVRMSPEGTQPLFGTFMIPMTVNNTVVSIAYTMDFTDESRFVLVDSLGNSMVMTTTSVTFASADCGCSYRLSIANFIADTDNFLNLSCTRTPEQSLLRGRFFDESHFAVYADITDQCGEPVSARANLSVSVGVGGTACTNAGVNAQVQQVWGCAFPGVNSAVMVCQRSMYSLFTWLFQSGLANGCPDLAQLLQAASSQLMGLLDPADVFRALHSQPGFANSTCGVRGISFAQAVPQLLEAAAALFRPLPSSNGSSSNSSLTTLEAYIHSYNTTNGRAIGQENVITSVCAGADETSFPLTVWLSSGLSNITIAELFSAPPSSYNYSASVVDPLQRSCCSPASRCVLDDPSGVRFYPDPAFYNGTGPGWDPEDGCICGTSAEGQGLGFRSFDCTTYRNCTTSADCAAGQTCLVYNCCSNADGTPKNVCVVNNECNQPGMGKRWLLEREPPATQGAGSGSGSSSDKGKGMKSGGWPPGVI